MRGILPGWLRGTLLLAPALVVSGVFFVGGFAQAVAQSLGHQPLLESTDWSTHAYADALADPAVRASVLLTLRIGVLSSLFAASLGLLAALVVRHLGRGRAWFEQLFSSVLAVPHVVGALAIGLLLAPSGMLSRAAYAVGLVDSSRGFPAITQDAFGWGVIAEYTWKETPFLALVALVALRRTGPLERASRTLGAGRWQRLRFVTLPMVATPLASGSVLVLAFAMGSYEVPVLLGRPFPAPLPVVAYRAYTDTDLTARPEAMAVAVLIAVLTTVVAAAYLFLVRLTARRGAA